MGWVPLEAYWEGFLGVSLGGGPLGVLGESSQYCMLADISEVTFEIFSLASLSALLISRLNNIVRLFFQCNIGNC